MFPEVHNRLSPIVQGRGSGKYPAQGQMPLASPETLRGKGGGRRVSSASAVWIVQIGYQRAPRAPSVPNGLGVQPAGESAENT